MSKLQDIRNLIQEHAVYESGQHGIEGETRHETAVRIQHEFDDVHGAAEQGADHRAEQVVHQLVRQGSQTDFQVGGKADGVIT